MAKKEESKLDKTKAKKKKLDKLYEKKPLVEFVVAILSIPSILLLLILNFKSLANINNAKLTPTPVSSVTLPLTNRHFYSRPVSLAPTPTTMVTTSTTVTQAPCNTSLGPVGITSPGEGDTVSSNPVEVNISYDNATYCSAVWSYSINGSAWSNYDNNSVALYNLPDGQIQFQLQVKSLTSPDTTTLTRDFYYNGQSNMPEPTTASGSAN